MAKAVVGVPKKFAAILRSDSGLVVDIGEFPQAFVDVSWTVGNADIAVVAPAQTEAEVLFSAPGVTTLTVSGTNKDGEAVSATIDIEAEAPTPKVVSVEIVEA